MGKISLEVISQGPQVSQIGAEDDGTISLVVVGDAVVEIEVDLGVEEGVLAEEGSALVRLIPWLATGVGCVAIWPVIVLAFVVRRRVVAALAPLEEVRQNLGNQAQDGEEDEEGRFGLEV